MHDIRIIRKDPEAFDTAMKRRGVEPIAAEINDIDTRHRAALTELQSLQSKRNEKSKSIGIAKSKGEDADAIIKEVSALKAKMADVEKESKLLKEKLTAKLAELPNIAADDVPDGADEADNQEIRLEGKPTGLNNAKDHVDLGENLGGIDFAKAAKLSGARFVWLQGGIAKLDRALSQFMLDSHTKNYGYTEVAPPHLVWAETMYGVGQLPKFADDAFKTQTGHYLIPTAEVPLTASVMGEITAEEELPLRYTALTQCFRREAGSAGRDTRGMIRQHQFSKVEMVSIVTPEQSAAEHERMTEAAESILKQLGLAFRTIILCTGDMGFSAQKTYDLEVWMPGQNAYREISSCSNCGEFQARRMNARCRKKGEKDTRFVHTLNGSGLAVGRALIAVLENYQQSDGTIIIPDVLRPYMGGKEIITAEGIL